MTGTLTGQFTYDGGTVALLEIEGGAHIAAEPRMADDLLTLHSEGEIVEIDYESWQVVRCGDRCGNNLHGSVARLERKTI